MIVKFSSWAFARRPRPFRWGFAAIAYSLAVALRFAIDDPLPPGFPFLTFFPAVTLTAFFAGLREGIAVAVLGGVTAWDFFIDPTGSFALHLDSVIALGLYTLIVSTDIFLVYLAHVAIDRLRAAEERTRALAEARELMFMELQHRVSNHLQVVSSLLKFQRRGVTDASAQRALDEASARLALVARIQRQLHDPSSQAIDIARFLKEMSRDIVEAAGASGRLKVEVQAEPLTVQAEQAVPFGLVATELLSNAVEHGFAEDGRGTIRVGLSQAGANAVTLTVADDGRGLPEGFDLDNAPSLGMTIARQFAEQLGGHLTMRSAGGTVAELTFPRAPAAA
jgi:two-component sensor histidine kinase